MLLETHDDEIPVLGARARLGCEYEPRDRGPGSVCFYLEDQETFERSETTIRLDPWFANTYEVLEWIHGRSLVVCGARQIVVLTTSPLRLSAAVALEYEEAETLDRPWIVESGDPCLLAIATERRVWCLDERIAIRWSWPARGCAEDRWIIAPPRMADGELHVPVRTMLGDSVVRIALDDGVET
jgi:hypothetical protein